MKMSEISICEIGIPERYVRRRIDNSSVRHDSELVKLKKTPDSSALMAKIENAWEAYDPDNILFEILFEIDGRERLGTVNILEDDDGTGYTIVLTVT